MLYKKWKERVFDPIHDKLSTHMDLSYPQLDSRKRALFTEYLAYRAKHTVFLDTMNKDYNPLSWTHDDVTLKVNDSADLMKVSSCPTPQSLGSNGLLRRSLTATEQST